MPRRATYVDYGQLLVSLLESGGELCAIKKKTIALSFVYSTGTRACLFKEVQKQVNSG